MYCKNDIKNRCQREVIDGCDGCINARYTEEETKEALETQIYVAKSM